MQVAQACERPVEVLERRAAVIGRAGQELEACLEVFKEKQVEVRARTVAPVTAHKPPSRGWVPTGPMWGGYKIPKRKRA